MFDGGHVLTGSLGDYKLPTMADIPPLETVLIHTAGGTGPYEAKAIGELANNATGAQLFELPITAERVYAALGLDQERSG